MWSSADVRFVLVDDLSGELVATVQVNTPDGTLLVMGEPRIEGRTFVAAWVHMHGCRRGAERIWTRGPADNRRCVPEGDGVR